MESCADTTYRHWFYAHTHCGRLSLIVKQQEVNILAMHLSGTRNGVNMVAKLTQSQQDMNKVHAPYRTYRSGKTSHIAKQVGHKANGKRINTCSALSRHTYTKAESPANRELEALADRILEGAVIVANDGTLEDKPKRKLEQLNTL